MSGHDGFRSLGELLAGGDPRRGEAAFLEGLNTGSTVNARNAATTNALAQARLRTDEAKARAELGSLGSDVVPTNIQIGRANLNPAQFTQADLRREELAQRRIIADPETLGSQRQFSSIAVGPGGAFNPLQFGPGGELVVERASDDPLGDILTTPTGQSQIAFDEARSEKALADAALAIRKRTNPGEFKSTSVVNIGLPPGVGLGDAVAADVGESTIPANIKPETATGIVGFGRALANTAFDIVNVDLLFPDADEAANALKDLVTRTAITGQQAIPGRPSNFLMEQLREFGVTPNDPFRGDQKSLNRLVQTSAFLGGEADRIQRALNFRDGADMGKNKRSDNQDALRAILALKQDYDVVISRFDIAGREGRATSAAGTSFTLDES